MIGRTGIEAAGLGIVESIRRLVVFCAQLITTHFGLFDTACDVISKKS